jgi:general stress protein CsbA
VNRQRNAIVATIAICALVGVLAFVGIGKWVALAIACVIVALIAAVFTPGYLRTRRRR